MDIVETPPPVHGAYAPVGIVQVKVNVLRGLLALGEGSVLAKRVSLFVQPGLFPLVL